MAPRKGGAIFIPMYEKRASQPAARLRQHQQNIGRGINRPVGDRVQTGSWSIDGEFTDNSFRALPRAASAARRAGERVSAHRSVRPCGSPRR